MTQTQVAVPREVMDLMERGHFYGVDGGIYQEVSKLNPAKFVVGTYLVLPAHGYDLHEANMITEVSNLRRVKTADIGGGPTIEVYEKIDPTQKAYAVFEISDWIFSWLEW